ncbi:MAG: glycosyltransferase family 2 protein [Patescibacteria group bacterium]
MIMKTSIVILDFEKSTRVLENVKSILRQNTDFDFEIIVAVNAATPAKRRRYESLQSNPRVKFIFNEGNLGYTRGINAAVKTARGGFICIVNPDIVWKETDTLSQLVKFLEDNPKVGLVGPRQINDPEGKVAMTVRAFPDLGTQIARRTWLRHLPGLREKVAHDEMQHLDYSKTQAVDWLQSSFWLLRKELWDDLGGLDERFFLFMSDPDFCWRVWESGHEVIYFPEATVHADGLRCSEGGFLSFFKKWTLRQHLRDAWKYRKKYRGKGSPRATVSN